MSEQSLEALARANEIRLARARIKAQVRKGLLTIPQALTEDCVQTMSLFGLLRCQPRWGDNRTLTFLNQIPVSEIKPIGGLTDRQRQRITELLEAPTTKRWAA